MLEWIVLYSVPISIALRIISCILLLVFCIPLQIKEAGVLNGLSKLRIQLLSFGLILFSTNLISLAFLFLAVNTAQKPINAYLQIINALAFLSLSLIGHNIYHSQYTDEEKAAHKELAKMEATQLKRKLSKV